MKVRCGIVTSRITYSVCTLLSAGKAGLARRLPRLVLVLAACLAFSLPFKLAAAQSCIQIDRIQLDGVTVFDAALLEAELPIGCLSFADLNALLEAVTLTYTNAGYVAARAYLPEQDLADGELTIVVIEGTLADIELRENGVPAPRRAATAFPGMQGRPLQLRRLEQGLSQINRLPSSEAVSELRPGDGAGESVLVVDVTQANPWRASVSLDDRGSATTGYQNLALTVSVDNPLGVNDQWLLSYQRSSDPGPIAFLPQSPLGRSLSLSGSLPYGNWTFALALSASDYVTDIPGVTGPIESGGNSASARLTADRVLSVNEARRWDTGASLTVKENEQQILGTTIDTASRRLSLFEAWLSRSQVLWGGQSQSRLALRYGLDAFGALDDGRAAAGAPKAQYRAALFDFSWGRQWDLDGQLNVLSTSLSSFYSDDALFGSEQIAIGGFNSVRGMRTSLLFGNRGAQVITNLSFPELFANEAATVSLTPYWGFDAGYIQEQEALEIDEGHLSSWTFGTTLAHKELQIEAVQSQVLRATSGLGFPHAGILSLQARLAF